MNRNRHRSFSTHVLIGSAAPRLWLMILMTIFSIPFLFATHSPIFAVDTINNQNGITVCDYRHNIGFKSSFDLNLNPKAIPPIESKIQSNSKKNNLNDIEATNTTHNIKVRLSFEEDVKAVYNAMIYIFNDEYLSKYSSYESSLDEDGSWTFNVPNGVYDIFVKYKLVYRDGTDRRMCISHSGIEVNADMEENIEDSEASHLLVLKKYLPNGEPVILPKVTYLDQEPWIEFDYTNATAHSYTCFQSLYNNIVGELLGSIVIADGYDDRGDALYGIWISEMSDDYIYNESVFIEGLNHSVDVISETTLLTKENLTHKENQFANDPKNYQKIGMVTVHHTPSYYKLPEYARTQGWEIAPWIDSINVGAVNFTMLPDSDLFACFPSNDASNDNPVKLAFSQTAVEAAYIDEWMPEGYYDAINLISLPKLLEDGEWMYINNNHMNTGCGLHNWPEGAVIIPGMGLPWPQLPGHEAFTFLEKDCEIVLGNSCPINYITMVYDVIGLNENCTDFIYGNTMVNHYLGRIGEARQMDNIDSSLVKINGEILDIDNSIYDSFGQWYIAFANDTERAPGEVEITMTNNNVTVDDIVGKNVTTISYDERSEEYWPPTLSMMITKNTNGKITDRFRTANEGIVEFSAGDFNYVDPWYVCAPIDVKVEYAPYGSEDFAELNFVEIPELFMMPNYGYFYRISLEQVNRKSTNGWFTMRFTLTDEVGNRQTQIIEPTFYIEDSSALDKITSDFGKTAVYSTDGVFMGEVNSSADYNNFKPGIYILRRIDKEGSTVRKIIIR